MRESLAFVILVQPRILLGVEARFLRKAVLGLTQTQLAARMAVNKTTVAV